MYGGPNDPTPEYFDYFSLYFDAEYEVTFTAENAEQYAEYITRRKAQSMGQASSAKTKKRGTPTV